MLGKENQLTSLYMIRVITERDFRIVYNVNIDINININIILH